MVNAFTSKAALERLEYHKGVWVFEGVFLPRAAIGHMVGCLLNTVTAIDT